MNVIKKGGVYTLSSLTIFRYLLACSTGDCKGDNFDDGNLEIISQVKIKHPQIILCLWMLLPFTNKEILVRKIITITI